jgi:hypothetical protein
VESRSCRLDELIGTGSVISAGDHSVILVALLLRISEIGSGANNGQSQFLMAVDSQASARELRYPGRADFI